MTQPTREELMAKLRAAHEAGRPDHAKRFAEMIRRQEAGEEFDAANERAEPVVPENGESIGGWITGLAQSAGKGAFFGGADEIQAGMGVLFDKFLGNDAEAILQGMDDVVKTDEDWKDSFELYRQDAEQQQLDFAEANPGVALAAEVAGALTSGLGGVAKVAGARGVTAAAATGAAEGALYGFLDENSTLEERAEAALKWGAGGAVIGAGIGKAIEKGGSVLANRAQRKAEEQGHALINKVQEDALLQVANGETPDMAWKLATRANGVNDEAVEAAVKITGRKPRIPMKNTPELERQARDIMTVRANGFGQPTRLDKTTAALKRVKEGALKVAGSASTDLRKASPRLFGAARKFEFDVKTKQQQAAVKFDGLSKARKEMAPSAYKAFSKAVYNGDFDEARHLVPEAYRPKLENAFKELRKMEKEARSVGYQFDRVANYWPRKVKDVDGFRKALGRHQEGMIEEMLKKEAAKKGRALAPHEKSKLTSDFMTKNERMLEEAKPGFTHQRTIDRVTDDMVDFYDDPFTALDEYVHRLVEDVEMKRFFNKSGSGVALSNLIQRMDPDDPAAAKALEESIGSLILKEGLDDDAARAVKDVLTARFQGGRRSMAKGLQHAKNVSTITALGNVSSAVTQIGDLANSMILSGVLPTVKAAMRQTARKGEPWKTLDVGVDNVIAQDLRIGRGNLDMITDKVLTATGFKKMDTWNKEVILNAAFNKAVKDLNRHGKKGIVAREKWMKKWGDIYGEDAEAVMGSLRDGLKNDWTKLHLFNQLSDVQPITHLEMPAAYMNNPHMRLLYTLKSYTIKQLDILRREAINPMLTPGERIDGAVTLAKALGFMGVMNGGAIEFKDWMATGEFNPDEIITDNAAESLMQLAFLGKYSRDELSRSGGMNDWIAGIIMPALPDVSSAASDPGKLARSIPLVGKPLYDWGMGGREKKLDRERQERRNELLNR